VDDLESEIRSSLQQAADRAPDADPGRIATAARIPIAAPVRARHRASLYVEVIAGVVLVLVISAMVAGLSGQAKPATGPGATAPPPVVADGGGLVDLPSSGRLPGHRSGLASPFSAILRADRDLDGGCVWLDAGDGAGITALWPIGYRARFDPLTEPVVIDQNGRLVATAGQRIYTSALPWRGSMPDRCAVSSDRKVEIVR